MLLNRLRFVTVTLSTIVFINHWITGYADVAIGGLFLSNDLEQQAVFDYVLEQLSSNYGNNDSKLIGYKRILSSKDKTENTKAVCDLFKKGVKAVIGPSAPKVSKDVNFLSESLNLIHLNTGRPSCIPTENEFSINLYPGPDVLSKIYIELVSSLGWNKMVVLYENAECSSTLMDVMQYSNDNGVNLRLQILPSIDDYEDVLVSLKIKGFKHFILYCDWNKAELILKLTNAINMTSSEYTYIITSLHIETMSIVNTDASVIGLGLSLRQELGLKQYLKFQLRNDLTNHFDDDVGLEAALAYDALFLLHHALKNVSETKQSSITGLTCGESVFWKGGKQFAAQLKAIKMSGLSGPISFDNSGSRKEFQLDILKWGNGIPMKLGSWNIHQGLSLTDVYKPPKTIVKRNINRLVVTTVLSEPYVMLALTSKSSSADSKFEGFSIDLLREISRLVRFEYSIKLANDGRYGTFNKDSGQWNGMLGELLEKKADLAIGDLTITGDRARVIDFTKSFMSHGIGLLYKRPKAATPNMFSFLSPLSSSVWMCIGVAYIGMSLFTYIVGRISPYEWLNEYSCFTESELIKNNFNIKNSFWHTLSILLQRGTSTEPRASSTRLVTGAWWMFSIIIISLYTAKLVTFLSLKPVTVLPFENVDELVRQTKIKYGCLKWGSTCAFFRDSKIPLYQKIWETMESSNPTAFTKTHLEGMSRVAKPKGDYVYFMESSSIDYIVEKRCDLVQVGGLLNHNGFGIGLQKGSPMLNPIDNAILHLQQDGTIQNLKKKWWKDKREGAVCSESSINDEHSRRPMGVEEIAGLFILLLAGIIISFVVGMFELLWKSRLIAKENDVTVASIINRNMNLAFSCQDPSTSIQRVRTEPDEDNTYPMHGFS